MTNARRAMILRKLAAIEKLADEVLSATREDDETSEMADARDYFWRIKDEAQEARGQWWAE